MRLCVKIKNVHALSVFEVHHALMKSVCDYETNTFPKALHNTIDGIYMRSDDASSLLSYVFYTQYKAVVLNLFVSADPFCCCESSCGPRD